jgi:ribosome-associated protein
MVTYSRTKSLLSVRAAIEKKATELVLLEMREVSSYTDYFLICSGKSDRQVQAIAQRIAEVLAELGIQPLGLEGTSEGKWVLMDYGDLVIHVFLEPIRRFYDLEGLWIDAPRIDLQKGANLGKGESESETENEIESETESEIETEIDSQKKTGQDIG